MAVGAACKSSGQAAGESRQGPVSASSRFPVSLGISLALNLGMLAVFASALRTEISTTPGPNEMVRVHIISVGHMDPTKTHPAMRRPPVKPVIPPKPARPATRPTRTPQRTARPAIAQIALRPPARAPERPHARQVEPQRVAAWQSAPPSFSAPAAVRQADYSAPRVTGPSAAPPAAFTAPAPVVAPAPMAAAEPSHPAPAPPPPKGAPVIIERPQPGPAGGPTQDAVADNQVQPNIPGDLADQIEKSFVRVEVAIEPDGSFTPALRSSSGSKEVDRLVLDALRKWRWRPALKDGTPIESRQLFRFEFVVE